jgi:bifunctional non-homologous end joining protein LigD
VQPELLTRIRPTIQGGMLTLDEAVRFIFDDRFWVQQKRDGERLMVRRCGNQIEGWNKRGQSTSIPTGLMSALLALPVSHFILDGEFERTVYHCWDLLQAEDVDLTEYTYRSRYEVLKVFASCPSITILPSWTSADEKERIVFELWRNGAEGVVFKDTEAPYKAGRAGQHFKLKFDKAATVRIRSVDALRDRAEIEMFDGNRWREVSGVKIDRTTVEPGDYIEVRYLSATEDMHIVQPVFIRIRTDVCDLDCSFDQLDFGGRWAHLRRRPQ